MTVLSCCIGQQAKDPHSKTADHRPAFRGVRITYEIARRRKFLAHNAGVGGAMVGRNVTAVSRECHNSLFGV
jgi:hypothetical protein